MLSSRAQQHESNKNAHSVIIQAQKYNGELRANPNIIEVQYPPTKKETRSQNMRTKTIY